MLTFRNSISFTPWTNRAFELYFGGNKIVSYDIETTGLSSGDSRIILAGFLKPGNDKKRGTAEIIQYFSEGPSDEKNVVSAALGELQKADAALTYNGRAFDIPFTKERAEYHGLINHDCGTASYDPLQTLFDFDLLTVIKRFSDLPGFLRSLSQKSIESYLGIDDGREDKITGYESIKLYESYLRTGSSELRDKILLHNRDDVIQLMKLLPVLNNCDLHGALLKTGFPAGPFLIKRIRPLANGLKVTAISKLPVIEYVSFPTQDSPFHLVSDKGRGKIELDFPAEEAAPGLSVIDIRALFSGIGIKEEDARDAASSFPGSAGGYLVIMKDGIPNAAGINLFLKTFLSGLTFVFEE